MKILSIALLSFFILFSRKAISQTTPSTHPKLDALFHHPPNNSQPSTTTEPATTTTPAPPNQRVPPPPISAQQNNADNATQNQVTNTPAAKSIDGNQHNPVITAAGQVQNPAQNTQVQQQASSLIQNVPVSTSMYRDTRLGSSSPLYNTYKKNDDGAGAITTNPNK